MSLITQGRTKGFFTVENYIQDGLLEVGGIDLAGFYTALKRFVDRREGAGSNSSAGDLMNWSVDTFCKKFKMGKNRFYRLAEMLWQLGLLDVSKSVVIFNKKNGQSGWQNSYVIHDYPPYEGHLKVVRDGSFKYKKKPGDDAEQGYSDMGIPPGEGSSESGIPKSGIPESEIPEGGSSDTGIPAAVRHNNKKQDLEKTREDQSIHHDHTEIVLCKDPVPVDRRMDGELQTEKYGGKTPAEIVANIQKRTGVTSEQMTRAITRANLFNDQGKVKTNFFGFLESICKTIKTEDQAKGVIFNDPEKIKKKQLFQSLYRN